MLTVFIKYRLHGEQVAELGTVSPKVSYGNFDRLSVPQRICEQLHRLGLALATLQEPAVTTDYVFPQISRRDLERSIHVYEWESRSVFARSRQGDHHRDTLH